MGGAQQAAASSGSKPFIVVIGGSYVGLQVAQELAKEYADEYRVLVIEQQTHFEHLFAFTRFAVCPGLPAKKAFIPFNPGTFKDCPPESGVVLHAKVVGISKKAVTLDQPAELAPGQLSTQIPYSYLVVATGCKLSSPSNIPAEYPGKLAGVSYLDRHADKVSRSKELVIIGGGAVGVQMATDAKEWYPEKDVVLVHSRMQVMNRFHPKLHEIVMERAKELDLDVQLGSRVVVPIDGFPNDGSTFDVELVDGRKIQSDFAIACTGYTPRSELIQTISPSSIDEWGYIKVRPTLQIADRELSNVFAAGDIADTGAPKAGWCGYTQGQVINRNIRKLMANEKLEHYVPRVPGILLTLGLHKAVIFRNPGDPEDKDPTEPYVDMRNDGKVDRDIDFIWKYRGGGPDYDA